jgi:LAS superfamily LD-carboxypeptidase LdcB
VKKYFRKIFTRNTCLAFLVGLSFFGLFKYTEYRLSLFSKQIDQTKTETADIENKLNERIVDLEKTITGSQSKLTDVLTREQEKNNLLSDQVGEVANMVGALSKLSKTDPELLKKYSKVYFLNEHYVPVSLSKIEPVLPHLEAMLDASKEDGMSLLVLSAYRSFDTQATLKSNYTVTYGAGTANSFSADQGYSEHQLGTAIDFTTGKLNGALEGFDKTPEYEWLKEHAYQYGFVLSYPYGNTYYKFEPWHWRFVGIALATKLSDEKINFYDMDQRLIDNYLANIFD